ncbi:hypothetical protein V2H45_08360 [Tumidithrix elongata RA019]|uniref:Uncharacterized protein n=1 Tax=Tumidithrix elongata BACA0141 TaxID=2716417 RepID=A0AAW9PVM6_9CYAN|nr:hypothetical protein [Tumidithrix elongata RA019]
MTYIALDAFEVGVNGAAIALWMAFLWAIGLGLLSLACWQLSKASQ